MRKTYFITGLILYIMYDFLLCKKTTIMLKYTENRIEEKRKDEILFTVKFNNLNES